MARHRAFALALVLVPALVWLTAAEDPIDPLPPAEAIPGDAEWEYQARTICDWPPLPAFAPLAKGKPAIVVVLAKGLDPAPALREAVAASAAGSKIAVLWAAPDEATAKLVQPIDGVTGAAAPEVDAFVTPPARPAVLLVGPDGTVRFAHFPGTPGDPDLIALEARRLVAEADPRKIAPPEIPAPTPRFQGALACAPCHRAQFKDWLMTPHSVALEDLRVIGRDRDPDCIGCHVVGWKAEGGYADRASHRRLADVQCEACHAPEKTHHDTSPMAHADYLASCAKCHTAEFSLTSDHAKAMEYVRHPKALGALSVKWADRKHFVDGIKAQTYHDFCAKTEYVGSEACRDCHQGTHAQWKGTTHATAFQRLRDAKKETDAKCTKCHTVGQGLPGGFVSPEKTPDVLDVGCESCHGPGKRHIDAKTKEERLSSIFKFDEKCPTCVVNRICRSCHDGANDPDFDLHSALKRVRHRDK